MRADRTIWKWVFRNQNMSSMADNFQFERAGTICSRVFLSKAGLASHQRFPGYKQSQADYTDSHPQ